MAAFSTSLIESFHSEPKKLAPSQITEAPHNLKEKISSLAVSLKIICHSIDSAELTEKVFEGVLKACQEKQWSVIHENKDFLTYLIDRIGRTLLMAATSLWDTDTVERLIHNRIGIHGKDIEGNTALHTAAKSGALNILNLLLKHLKIDELNNYRQTPLHVAIFFGQDDIVRLLLSKGANTKISFPFSSSVSVAALPWAVIRGETGCVDTIVEIGGKQQLGMNTPGLGNLLHISTTFRQINMLKHLFAQYPAIMKNLLEEQNESGLTSFSLAARDGFVEALILFKEQGANVEVKDPQGNHPLHQAVLGEQHLTVDWLLYLGCEINSINFSGLTPSALAATIVKDKPSSSEALSIANLLQTYSQQAQIVINPEWVIKRYENLVFQGGGARSVSYLGSLRYLEEKGCLEGIKRVAGTSTGAVVSTLMAMNYCLTDIQTFLLEKGLDSFLDHPMKSQRLDSPILAEAVQNLHKFYHYQEAKESIHPVQMLQELFYIPGLCESGNFLRWIEDKIFQKTQIPHCTFKELRNLVAKNQAKHLHIYAVKVGVNPQIVHFSSEESRWDDLIISDVICCSVLIPGIFKPHTLHFKDTEGIRYPRPDLGLYVDGGILCNFPIETFDYREFQQAVFLSEEEKKNQKFNPLTLGFNFCSFEKEAFSDKKVETVCQLISSVANLYYNTEEAVQNTTSYNAQRIISLDFQEISSSLEISLEQQKKLIKAAYETTKSILDSKLSPPKKQRFFDFLKLQNRLKLPASLPSFIGRKDILEDLEQMCFGDVREYEKSILHLHLHGFAGLGKSETAIFFTSSHLDKFSLIWHIRCENDLLYEADYRSLATALRIPFDKEPIGELIYKIYLKLSMFRGDKPWLLILDGIEKKVPIPARGGIILSTSQQEKLWEEQKDTSRELLDFPISQKEKSLKERKTISLGPFKFQQTRDFFTREGKFADLEKLEDLHLKLQGWPILLSNAYTYILDTHTTISDYLQELETIEPLFIQEEEAKYPYSLAQAFELTLNRLQNKNPQIVKFLFICAYLNPEEIQISLFHAWHQGRTLKWKKEVLYPLENLSIIHFQDDSFSLHSLWQTFLRKKLAKEVKNEGYVREAVELIVQAGKQFFHEKPATWKQGKACALHLEAICKSDQWEILKEENNISLFDVAGIWLQRVQGNAEKALEYFNIVLDIRREILGEEHQDTALSYNNAALSLGTLGSYERALEYNQKALEIRRKILGEEHPATAASYNNVGVSLGKLWKIEEALKFLEETHSVLYKDFTNKNLYMAISYNNIAVLLSHLGRFQEALENSQKALKICCEILGEEHPITATSYDNIGASLGHLERYQEALENSQKAFEIKRAILGDEHPDMATSYNNISLSLRNLGKGKEALLYERKEKETRFDICHEAIYSFMHVLAYRVPPSYSHSHLSYICLMPQFESF